MLSINAAYAGMPSVGFTDLQRVLQPTELTKARLEAISFFAVGLLVVAALIRWVWNAMRKDFPVLPRLSYLRALGLVFLWGLLFVLVLTMISGARELLTPGAWEKVEGGVTYKLADVGSPVERQITERVQAIERLRETLVTYADAHNGYFPRADDIPASALTVPGADGAQYVYLRGRSALNNEEGWVPPGIVAYEPEAVGPDRLTLETDGSIVWLPAEEIERRLGEAKP